MTIAGSCRPSGLIGLKLQTPTVPEGQLRFPIQSYSLDWFTIDAGEGTSQGGMVVAIQKELGVSEINDGNGMEWWESSPAR